MDRVCVDQDPAGESAAAPGAAVGPLLQVLNRMGCGGIVLDEAGQVLDSNAAAKALLFEETS